MKPIIHTIEPLESRIAPAMVTLKIVNAHTATYTDVDGDHVTVSVSTGTLTAALFTGVAGAHGDQLQTLDLSGGGFDKGNVVISVGKVAGGDGVANIGYINSTGHDLGVVVVNGDLGQIDAGSGSASTPAIKSLIVRSMGRLGTDSQAGGSPSLTSNISGGLGALTVAGDVEGEFINVQGGSIGTIGTISIGGSLIGAGGANSGEIASTGGIGLVKIGHDVQGGAGSSSGSIISSSRIASVTIGGSLIGGSFAGGAGTGTGEIFASSDIGPIRIGHSIQGGVGSFSGLIYTFGKLGNLVVGGSVIGGIGQDSGEVFANLNLGAITVGHDVAGGVNQRSGLIESQLGAVTSVAIGGSLIGGGSNDTGEIYSNFDLGPVTIGHDVQGGSGSFSGMIRSRTTAVSSVTIGGSLIGGSNGNTGEVASGTDMGAVKIGHDLIGASVTGSTSLTASGLIASGGRIASVAIGGSIISGTNSGTGTLTQDATILATDDMGSLTVGGSLVGNTTAPIVISARGQHTVAPTATTNIAIAKIAVGGRVEYANILGGYDTSLNAVNGDAQIGAVAVAGDWIASNLVAGAKNFGADNSVGGTGLNADNVNFGDSHDASIGAGASGITARIASIVIGGQVFGTPNSTSATDHFGFVAEQIVGMKIGGSLVTLTVGAHNDNLAIGPNGDVNIHEV